MALLDLFITSSMPVIKVLLITSLGSFLALDHINVLGDDARKHLNKIVFFVFNPALVASNLAKALKHESMATMWLMALNVLITFILGSALGLIIVYVTRTPRNLRGLILGCCAAGNMGNMLLIIVPTMCNEKGTPFGAPDECHAYGMAYASLSMAIGAIYLWSYVYNMVRLCANNDSNEERINSSVRTSSPEEANCKLPLLPPNQHGIQIDNRLAPTSNASSQSDNSEVGIVDKLKRFGRKVSENLNLKTLFAPSTIGAVWIDSAIITSPLYTPVNNNHHHHHLM